jgi:hypothetical protein
VRVQPRAGRDEIAGERGGALVDEATVRMELGLP